LFGPTRHGIERVLLLKDVIKKMSGRYALYLQGELAGKRVGAGCPVRIRPATSSDPQIPCKEALYVVSST
jgi:hypothetical protein